MKKINELSISKCSNMSHYQTYLRFTYYNFSNRIYLSKIFTNIIFIKKISCLVINESFY